MPDVTTGVLAAFQYANASPGSALAAVRPSRLTEQALMSRALKAGTTA